MGLVTTLRVHASRAKTPAIAFACRPVPDLTSATATQERSGGANAGRALCHESARERQPGLTIAFAWRLGRTPPRRH